jgi:hypothetical protein
MSHETTLARLSDMWEKMQTARKPETIVNKANALVSAYLSQNESIPAHMWPFIDFFQHAETVLKTKNFQ